MKEKSIFHRLILIYSEGNDHKVSQNILLVTKYLIMNPIKCSVEEWEGKQ